MSSAGATYVIEGQDATGAAFASIIKNAQETSDKVSGLFEAAFAGISIAGIAEFADKIIDLGDQIDQAAKKAGVSGNAFSELAYAAKQSGVGTDALSQSLATMNKNLSLAATGAKLPNETLQALGLTLEQLQGLKPDQQFEVLAQQISKLSSPADQARAEMELFGRAGADLGPLFEQGAAGIEKARTESEKIGAAFSDTTLAQLEKAHQSVDALKASFEGFAATLAAKAAPALSSFFGDLTADLNGDQQHFVNANVARITSALGTLDPNDWGQLGKPGTGNLYARTQLLQQLHAQDSIANLSPLTPEQLEPVNPNFTDLINNSATPPGYGAFDQDAMLKMINDGMAEFETKLEIETTKKSTDLGQTLNNSAMAPLKEITTAHQHMWDQLDQISQAGAKGIQDDFTNFLINPSQVGFKGLAISFAQTIDQMLAKAAAADLFGALFGSDKEGNSGLGGDFLNLLTGAGLFGSGAQLSSSGYLNSLDDSTSSALNGLDYSLPGFATGGSFNVGGQGGTDTNLVAFKATRGETVSVTTHGQNSGDTYIFQMSPTIGDIASRADVANGMKQSMDGAVAKIQDMKRRGSFK